MKKVKNVSFDQIKIEENSDKKKKKESETDLDKDPVVALDSKGSKKSKIRFVNDESPGSASGAKEESESGDG